jgi:hypothetical protein
MTVIPTIASPVEAETVERYVIVPEQMAAHGVDPFHQNFRLYRGDVVIRTDEVRHTERLPSWMNHRRIYNETQGISMWVIDLDGSWSDRKHLCRIDGGLPTWFERI